MSDSLYDGVNYCIMDYDLKDYNDSTVVPLDDRVKVLEKGLPPGSGSIIDLHGTPAEFPSVEECKETDWITIVRNDGMYFRNPLTGAQKAPKSVSNLYADVPPSSHFLHLRDTPSSYDGHGGKILAVGSFEDTVEFIEPEVYKHQFLALIKRVEELEKLLGVTPPPPSWVMTPSQEKDVLKRLDALEEYWDYIPTTPTKVVEFDYATTLIRLNRLEALFYEEFKPIAPPTETHVVTEEEYYSIIKRINDLELYWNHSS